MNPATLVLALQMANFAASQIAYWVDFARQNGATEEQLAQIRLSALARYDAAAAAVQAAEPPKISG